MVKHCFEKEEIISEEMESLNKKIDPSSFNAVNEEDDDWERSEISESFQKIQLVPPPPSQDGGAYERSNCGFADSDSVSAAAANAVSSRYGQLDPVLVSCLENPRERMSLLKFEDQIVNFIRESRENQLVFPPLSSYHRLIIHRLAERCFLEHQTADYNPYLGYDGNASRVVTLFKTARSCVPTILLIDLSAERNRSQIQASSSVPKIMIRKRGSNNPTNAANRTGAETRNVNRSMEDREKAYAEARARIFGEGLDTVDTSESTVTNVPQLGSRQAKGPDASRGFLTRGSSAEIEEKPIIATQNETKMRKSITRELKDKVSTEKGHQNWKETKALLRNREEELNDPDFARNHDIYRSSYGGRREHYAQRNIRPGASERYHLQESYDYSGASVQYGFQPPLPPAPYTQYNNRIDDGHLQPTHWQYSFRYPPNRGSYVNPPLPSQGTQAYAVSSEGPIRYTQSRSYLSGGEKNVTYNEEFPPLGR